MVNPPESLTQGFKMLERIADVAITTALLGKDETVEVSTHLSTWIQSDGCRSICSEVGTIASDK